MPIKCLSTIMSVHVYSSTLALRTITVGGVSFFSFCLERGEGGLGEGGNGRLIDEGLWASSVSGMECEEMERSI